MKRLKRTAIIITLFLGVLSCSKEETNQIESDTKVTPKGVLRNYLQSSYELSNYQTWISPSTIFESQGMVTPKDLDPTDITSSCQLDIDLDGDEDIFSFRNYDINTPNVIPSPLLYLNTNNSFFKSVWNGPNTMRGNKSLVGDFNGDKKPDVFSVEAYDPPSSCNCMPEMTTNKILFNTQNNLTSIQEIKGLDGFWVTGCSGDVDNDGDLDVMVFNFHRLYNNVNNKILINDGLGKFTITEMNEISQISLVDASELIDVNKDGNLDLILNYRNQNANGNILKIFWGNGKSYSFSNSTDISIPNIYVYDIDAYDANNDGVLEIILFSIDPNGWAVDFYGSSDKGKSFSNQNSRFIRDNENVTSKKGFIHVKHIMITDVDNNNKMDIVSSNRSVNVRWEQDSDGVFKRK